MKFQIFKLTHIRRQGQKFEEPERFILTKVSGPIETLPEAEEQLNQLSDPSQPGQYTILPIYTR